MQRHAIFDAWNAVQFGLEHFTSYVRQVEAMDVHDKASVVGMLHYPYGVLSLLPLLNYDLLFGNLTTGSFAIMLDIEDMFYVLDQMYSVLIYRTVSYAVTYHDMCQNIGGLQRAMKRR